MITSKKRTQGFTIVELLIVIVVIGILALLVITTYSGIQAKARNSQRQSDIAALQTQLEAFYSQNGYYPSLTDLNTGTSASTSAQSTWVTTNMKSLDQAATTDPSNAAGSHTMAATVSAAATAKEYSYTVTNSAGTTCEAADTTCALYTVTANFEGTVNGSTTYAKSNLD
jgi:type IV pilus assembly protein PilA